MKICIVGGGSAGWMSATTFSRCLDCEITVVESPNVPTSGVGESTLFEIQDWMNLVGIDRDELVRKTNGTYKHSIKFTNWLKKDSGSFHYPFGEHPNFSPERWWEFHTKNEDKVSPNDYGTMLNVVGTIAEKGKFDELSPYAYHFDAVKFANLLKDGLEGAVEYISGDVVD
jgi:tryptophan halogenase